MTVQLKATQMTPIWYEGTLSCRSYVSYLVAFGLDDPAVPVNVLEVDEHGLAAADVAAHSSTEPGSADP